MVDGYICFSIGPSAEANLLIVLTLSANEASALLIFLGQETHPLLLKRSRRSLARQMADPSGCDSADDWSHCLGRQ
jgi:hypothetical protein